jgi:hypothetical protein
MISAPFMAWVLRLDESYGRYHRRDRGRRTIAQAADGWNDISSAPRFGYDPAVPRERVMNRLLVLGSLLVCCGIASPVAAGDDWQIDQSCYWCIRDAIYADVSLIDRLGANPDIDDGIKGPQIVAARADIHRLRALLGPIEQVSPEPCCYTRRPLHIR